MQTFSPVPAKPTVTQHDASAALKRLIDSSSTLSTELSQLPQPHHALLEGLKTESKEHLDQEISSLLQQIDAYWRAPGASKQSRRTLFATSLEKTLHDEALLKSHENDLGPNAAACLPVSATAEGENSLAPTSVHSLHVKLNEQTWVEIKGALVMTLAAQRTLLALPGSGLTEFATQNALLEKVVQWLNDDELRWALLINADQRHQDAAFGIAEDPDLFIEAFDITDVQLQAITDDPYRHALKRQLDKQREDLRYVCGLGLNPDPKLHAGQIESAIRMPGLFGPSAMLERREQALAERKLRSALPDWIKIATPADLEAYTGHIKRYDQAREALSSALNGAASAEQYADVNLRVRLANDLGYDIAPDKVTVSTQRTLPVTGESYTVTRSLPQLALYGMHPDDQRDGSEFLTQTTISVDGAPAEDTYVSLTPAYLAGMIDELKLRISFGGYQRTTYAKEDNQKLMRELLHIQIAESAHAAKMQGHISLEDLSIIESLTKVSAAGNASALRVQHIRINDSDTLARVLVFRKENAQGGLERLIMFSSDAPRDRLFQSFHNETQLCHELVGWAAMPEMHDYLLQQLQAPNRAALNETLARLKDKPHPESDFIQLVSLDSYDAGVQGLVSELVRVSLSEHETHTPNWYLEASLSNRQKLVALEDAAVAAARNYEAQAHTKVQDFEDYVHQRASEKICQLLKVPAGTVDPDQIVITSERETITYTRMIRNGYDDSIGFLNPAADTMATFSGPEGVDLSVLTPASVARSVHGKWLADDYAALIRRTLLNPQSTGYEYRRQTSTAITVLQMQAAALRSFLKGHIDAAQYRSLEGVLSNAHLSDPATRARYPIYPLQIHVDKPFIASGLRAVDQLVMPDTNLTHVETVQGCFALLSADNRLAALLYTPEAPDGVEFRVFSSFVESLSQPGMIDYYKDRCRIKARRVLSFFLNDMKRGNANKPPVIPRESISDLAQICFNRPIERKLRDVEETTTGRHDMLSNLIWNSVDIIATVLTLPFPPASFAVGVALSLRDSFRAFQALTGESADDASALILASVLNAAGAAGDLSQGLKGFGGMARKLASKSQKGARPAALKKLSKPARQQGLYPVEVQNESFLISKPNASGQAPVYRSLGFDTDELYATRHYAVMDDNGSWQPLGQPSTPPSASAPNGVGADRIVNISLDDLPKVNDGHAKGVALGNGKHYIEMNGLAYQVHYDTSVRCWHIVDPKNPFAFFGRQPVRLNEQGQWKVVERSRLRGGGKDDPTGFTPLPQEATSSSAAASSLSDYELPQHLQPHMEGILGLRRLDDLGAGIDEYFETYYAQMRPAFLELRENLYRDAQAFFSRAVELPPRPSLPDIDASTTVSGFLENVFNKSNGLVLSEAPKSIGSKRLLMTHMQTLAEQRVEVLYIPHLFTDKHVRKLAKYYAQGRSIRSGSHEIKYHLKSINNKSLDNLSQEYDYYHLIKEAHRHNIEVRPLSSSVSYPLDDFPVATPATDGTAVQKMSKFFSHKVIRRDIAAAPSKRWIALLDEKLATTYEQIPGIADLEGAISVHIQDVPAGRPTLISRDAGLVQLDAQPVGCDFKIEFADRNTVGPAASPAIIGRLDNPPSSGAGAAAAKTDARDTGFRWEEGAGWQRVAAENQLAENPLTAMQQSLTDATYEIPAESADTLHHLAYDQPRGLDGDYFTVEPKSIPVQTRFFELRAKLRNDANQILSVDLPPRPTMPVIEPQTSPAQFIQSLYQQTDGMVIGEFHSSVASKKFIIDNMPLLAQQNVKTLYMEHLLTDLHQVDLDRFFDTGIMSDKLLKDLRTLDTGHMTDPQKVYNFEKLVLKAQQHGIEIRAIDCAASYHLKGLRLPTPTTRQQMMNYFASRTIRRHQAIMGKHKWIALVGNSHCNIYRTVPGLAELEGAIGIRVAEVPAGVPTGIARDSGEIARLSIKKEEGFVKGDFKLDMHVPGTALDVTPSQALSLQDRLARPGEFVIEEQADHSRVIVHRSRDNEIYRTPIRLDAEGKPFVNRPNWAAIHLQSYENLDALVLAMARHGLSRVG